MSPAGQNRYVRAHNERKRASKDDRNRQMFEMWKGGATEPQIARAFDLSNGRAHEILKRALREAREARLDYGQEYLETEMERLTMIVRHNWTIVTANCKHCKGEGEREVIGIAGVGATESKVICDACRGDGRANPPDVRIRASKEARAAIDQRVKMMGGYEPDRLIVTGPEGVTLGFRADLETMPADEIERALADYAAGVEAATKLQELEKTAKLDKSRG